MSLSLPDVEIRALGNHHWYVYLHGPGSVLTVRYTNNEKDARRDAEAFAQCLGCRIEESVASSGSSVT
jgi:hypothetical protein